MVITGLHHSMLPIDLQSVEVLGGIYTFPVVALNNVAQASAVAAFVVLNRRSAKAKEVGVPAFISGYLGVTEPAMFGVNLKLPVSVHSSHACQRYLQHDFQAGRHYCKQRGRRRPSRVPVHERRVHASLYRRDGPGHCSYIPVYLYLIKDKAEQPQG